MSEFVNGNARNNHACDNGVMSETELSCASYNHDSYATPLTKRYASPEMSFNFSERKKITTWRKLWLYLAKAQKSLGTRITEEQINEIEKNIDDIDFVQASIEERATKHDVMAHLRVFSNLCPNAASILHLGSTSCYLTDNTDLIAIKDGFHILIPKLLKCLEVLADFCEKYKSLPTLGCTHFQPAQLTTVGKRGCLWLCDLVTDYKNFTNLQKRLRFRGCKGAVGTQASFLTLFSGNYDKVREMDWLVAKMAGFDDLFEVTGQTYSRKSDVDVIMTLASFGCSVHKICTDIRLLCGLQEIREPFAGDTQVGSSAMPYKHNPTRSERCCGLARYLSSLVTCIMSTHSVQWLERTLDDSSARRIIIPEAFLIADTILETLLYVFNGMTVHPNVINKRINDELPFLSVETILIDMVLAGANRQECHERLRLLAHDVSEKIKSGEATSQLFLEKLMLDNYFAPVHPNIDRLVDPQKFIGCAVFQVNDYLNNIVNSVLRPNKSTTADTVRDISI